MKKWILGLMAALVVLAVGASAQTPTNIAPRLVSLTDSEAAFAGANYAADVVYNMLTSTTTNTSQTFVLPIPANTHVAAVGARLITPFDNGWATIATNSVLFAVGDTSGGANYIPSVQLGKSSTPVYWQPAYSVITVNSPTNVTNVTVTSAQYYSAATNLYFTLTPTNATLSANSQGQVRVYFRLHTPGGLFAN